MASSLEQTRALISANTVDASNTVTDEEAA